VIVLERGTVKIGYFTEDGKEVVLAVRGPGDLLGELSAIDGEPMSASAMALEDVEVLTLGAEDFRSFLAQTPSVALRLMELLASRLRDADRKRIEFGAYDTVSRTARRLVEMADRFGHTTEDGLRISLALSQEELAGWIGASRESVSKALGSLKARGLIEIDRREINVIDLPGLRKRAG
jgi:CRP-like cAMP-binding protein